MTNEVIMIYANEDKKDIGVLQDYSFDMCYGDSENDFECKIQKYNPALIGNEAIKEDYILYIEFTEYGGIIDKKTIDTKTGVITLAGRTWHGFLNSFIIEPPKGYAYKIYQGEANTVIAAIIQDIGLGNWFVADDTDSGIEILKTSVRYEAAYDCIMSMLLERDAKLAMWYQGEDYIGGKIHLRAISRVNTGAFEEFDTSQTPFKAGKAYNKVNDLICLGQGNGEKRAVIHLYANENGNVLPYCREQPAQDSDYYTDLETLSHSTNPEDIANYAIINAQRITGDKRYSLIYDYPNAEIVTNYLRLTTKPGNWDSTYSNYYYKKDSSYSKFEITRKDTYVLTDIKYGKKEPPNWKSSYKNFYLKETMDSTSFKKVEDLPESEAQVSYHPNLADDGIESIQTVDANAWKNYFETEWSNKSDLYYEKVPLMQDYAYEKAKPVKVESYELYPEEPLDWAINYQNYYLRKRTEQAGVYEYFPVPGDEKEVYVLMTQEPTDWPSDYDNNNYFIKATRTIRESGKIIISKGEYITVKQAIDEYLIDERYRQYGVIHLYPKWKKKTFYVKRTITQVPAYRHLWDSGEGYFYEGVFYKVESSVAPTFTPGKYYYKVVDAIPEWKPQEQRYSGSVKTYDFGGYWEVEKNVEQIPTFEKQDVYYAVEDRFAELCRQGKKKLEELSDQDSLDISLTLESNYDVGDIVGSIDEETGIDVTKQILRKIVKIKKGIISVDYEVQ